MIGLLDRLADQAVVISHPKEVNSREAKVGVDRQQSHLQEHKRGACQRQPMAIMQRPPVKQCIKGLERFTRRSKTIQAPDQAGWIHTPKATADVGMNDYAVAGVPLINAL